MVTFDATLSVDSRGESDAVSEFARLSRLQFDGSAEVETSTPQEADDGEWVITGSIHVSPTWFVPRLDEDAVKSSITQNVGNVENLQVTSVGASGFAITGTVTVEATNRTVERKAVTAMKSNLRFEPANISPTEIFATASTSKGTQYEVVVSCTFADTGVMESLLADVPKSAFRESMSVREEWDVFSAQ